MTWIDIAGRWLIVGLGTAVVFALLIVAWGYCLTWFINGFNYTKHFIEYLRYRNEFHEWKKQNQKKRRVDTLTEEEKQELREIGAKRSEQS